MEVRLYGTISNDLHAGKSTEQIRRAHGGAEESATKRARAGWDQRRRLAQLETVRGGGAFDDANALEHVGSRPTSATHANWRGCCARVNGRPFVPQATDEAMQDLCRARTDAVDDRRRTRHRLKDSCSRYHYQEERVERSMKVSARAGIAASGDEGNPGRVSPGIGSSR